MVGHNGEHNFVGETLRRDERRDIIEGRVLVESQ